MCADQDPAQKQCEKFATFSLSHTEDFSAPSGFPDNYTESPILPLI